jgi:hypothetical protein
MLVLQTTLYFCFTGLLMQSNTLLVSICDTRKLFAKKYEIFASKSRKDGLFYDISMAIL